MMELVFLKLKHFAHIDVKYLTCDMYVHMSASRDFMLLSFSQRIQVSRHEFIIADFSKVVGFN